jgi:hypothetical protein
LPGWALVCAADRHATAAHIAATAATGIIKLLAFAFNIDTGSPTGPGNEHIYMY